MTPFLAYIEEYSNGIESGRFTELIGDAVKRSFAKHKDEKKIQIKNEDLYVFEETMQEGGARAFAKKIAVRKTFKR